jgi:predicted enzyme related to lactoylglutathione lyase
MPSATLSLFELPAHDSRKLADFFRVVFGWDAVEVPWAGPRYLRLLPPESGEPPGAGILERAPGGAELVDRLTVMIRVEGEPLEAVMARVEAAGGVPLLAPSSVGSSGRYARFLDPEGNSFGLWSDRET